MAKRLMAVVGLVLACSSAIAAEHGVKVLSPDQMKIGASELNIGLSQNWNQPLPAV